MAVSGPLVVAFVVGVTPGKWARVWAERLPGHQLELKSLSQADALAALRSGDADAALLRLPIDDESLSAIPLYAEQPVVVAPKDHPVAAFASLELADLAAEILLEQEWADAVELVAANVGLAIMPQAVARALSRRDVVARPVTDAVETRIALAWLTARTTPAVEEFIGIVRGRTANSSRGTVAAPPPVKPPAKSGRQPNRTPPRKGSGRRR
ncbi:MAG: LysR family transcriptional regulator [Rhodoglobus sp.]|nr:LysR family transcriptional regulator [Rhodoglobus sp.]